MSEIGDFAGTGMKRKVCVRANVTRRNEIGKKIRNTQEDERGARSSAEEDVRAMQALRKSQPATKKFLALMRTKRTQDYALLLRYPPFCPPEKLRGASRASYDTMLEQFNMQYKRLLKRLQDNSDARRRGAVFTQHRAKIKSG